MQAEPTFRAQLWRTVRTLAVAFLLISGIGALFDERGLGRGILHNPDMKPQMESKTKFEDVKGVDEAKVCVWLTAQEESKTPPTSEASQLCCMVLDRLPADPCLRRLFCVGQCPKSPASLTWTWRITQYAYMQACNVALWTNSGLSLSAIAAVEGLACSPQSVWSSARSVRVYMQIVS